MEILLARSSSEVHRLSKELHNVIQEMAKSFKELFLYIRPKFEFETFTLPSDARFMINKKFRMLREDYLKQKLIAERCSSLLPQIEDTLRPLRHHLAVLQLDESELRSLDIKIDEVNTQERIEHELVEKYIQKKRDTRQKAAQERERMNQETLNAQMRLKEIEDQAKEIDLKAKRSRLLKLLRDDMHRVYI